MAEYIDRAAAICIADYAADENPYSKEPDKPETYSDYNQGWNDACDYIRDKLEEAPAADVAPVVHGWWIPIRESEMTGWNPEFAGCNPIGGYKCSECGKFAVFDCNDEYVLSDFCPQCGAKMDGGKKHDD